MGGDGVRLPTTTIRRLPRPRHVAGRLALGRSGARCRAGSGLVVLVVAALLLAGCEDVAQQCPPLAHPPILTVAAATNPCQAKAGETAQHLRLRVVKTYERSQAPGSGRYPLRCGDNSFGYLHMLHKMSGTDSDAQDHCDPVNDAGCSEVIAYTLEHGAYGPQASGNPRFTAKYNEAESACRNGDWGFRVVVGGGTFSYGGIITAFRLRTAPPANP
jgi:hypothetical protein